MKRLIFTLVLLAIAVVGQTAHDLLFRRPSPRWYARNRGRHEADPDRSGPAVAIIVNGHSYLVDCGPGVVRRAAAASRNGVPGSE